MAALFQPGRGCLLCHVRDGDQIVAPAIPSNWFQKARFTHAPHRFESCDRCHHMDRVSNAESLEVPGVETCRQCHHENGANDGCITCHPYHR